MVNAINFDPDRFRSSAWFGLGVCLLPLASLRTGIEIDTDRLSVLAEKGGYRVAGLAKGLGLSQRKLERLFHQRFGKPPRTWIVELRMRRAIVLLAEYRMTKIVASKLGYSSPGNFLSYRADSDYFGVESLTLAPVIARESAFSQRGSP